MKHTNEDMVIARMEEFVANGTPWHRRLWQTGTFLALREVVEYANGVVSSKLRAEGLEYSATSTLRLVERDRGFDSQPAVQAVCDLLRHTSKLTKEPARLASLQQLIRRAEPGYLDRWADDIATSGVRGPEVELIARLCMAHLLDQSFSTDHLHGWLRAMVKEHEHESPPERLASILRAGSRMASRPPVDYTVVVPFQHIPGGVVRQARASDRFYNHRQLLGVLDENGIEHPTIREGGGALTFQVTAREPKSAVIATELELRRLRARCVVGDPGERPKHHGIALVLNASSPRWTSLPEHTGAVFLPTLRDHSGLLPGSAASLNALDDVLELLAAVETTSSWASVSALWAALEGLLSRPGESGALAADRAAELVACSFPRAELSTLLDRTQDPDAIPESVDPYQFMLARIGSKGFEVDSPADAAAVERVRQMQGDPHGVLNRMKGYFSDAFRRLYNQRNLVLHGGRFDSVTLPVTMRTLPPLTGAAVDRIIHGLAAGTVSNAASLAARASNELQLVGHPGGRDISALLD